MQPLVLLVDDDESNRLTLEAVLEDEGYRVECAATVAEGRTKLRDGSEPYAAALLDYNLPDGCGASLIPELRANNPGAPAVLITGTPVDLQATGADAIVTKGDACDDLITLLAGYLGN
ncbi:MAG: response regulator [Polyangiaceae bacterium]